MVEIFREVKRVLRDDGTLWLNMGDSFASAWPAPNTRRNIIDNPMSGGKRGPHRQSKLGAWDLKEKDLIGMPWRVAFALQADGWWLRSDIIWAKPNPMPESVTDRPTKAHEYLFLLTKSERYYYDQDAVRERTGNELSLDEYAERTAKGATWQSGMPDGMYAGSHKHDGGRSHPSGRNIRTVWDIATQPFPEAHFATFPEALVEPCIKAGSKAGDVVMDPFAGSGTVGVVALKHGRSFVGLDLQPDYCRMAVKRIEDDAPLFNRKL